MDWQSGNEHSGVALRVYPDGLVIWGWYDSMVGIEPGFVTWEELDALKKKARRRRPYQERKEDGPTLLERGIGMPPSIEDCGEG